MRHFVLLLYYTSSDVIVESMNTDRKLQTLKCFWGVFHFQQQKGALDV